MDGRGCARGRPGGGLPENGGGGSGDDERRCSGGSPGSATAPSGAAARGGPPRGLGCSSGGPEQRQWKLPELRLMAAAARLRARNRARFGARVRDFCGDRGHGVGAIYR